MSASFLYAENLSKAQKLGMETVHQISSSIDQFNASSGFLFDRGIGKEMGRRTSGLVEQFDVVSHV